MQFHGLLQLAFEGLVAHKLRSALSVLGIVFGVAAVVAMSSVGEGARREALAQVGALGIDSLTVRATSSAPGKNGIALRLADAQALGAVVPAVASVAPVRLASVPSLKGKAESLSVVATTPDYADAALLRIARGRFLSQLDVKDAKRVVVLGAETARALLGDPLGQLIRLGGDWYQVVGVLEERSSPRARGNPIRARDLNRAALVPVTSLAAASGQADDAIDEIAVRVASGDAVAPAAEVTRRVLKRRLPGTELEIVVPREILRQRERTQRIFNVVTGVVAAIGLLVGGIGIMNIMLASVAERTSEIGLRRACGATRRDIASQFLAESSLLTGGGGVIGLGLGVLASLAIQRWAEWPTALSLLMFVAAALLAAGVGVGSGSYPAWRAAQLEPIDALRRE